MANFADSNRAGIKLIQENNLTWGVTPTSGKTRDVRITSSSLVAEKETVVSDELRSDRMVSSVVEVSAMTTGDVNYEFSAGSHDILMQAFLLGLWTKPMEFDFYKGVAWGTTSRIDIPGGDFRDYFVVGRRIKTSGFANPANNKYSEIASLAFSGGITQVTVTTTTAVVEAATSYTKVQDANDVIILNNTSIRFGTSGAPTIDSNGTNAFASAIAAGALVAGQNIYVDNGSGRETGTFDFTTNAVDSDTFIVNDGANSIVFELDANNGTGTSFGNQTVALGGTGANTATNLAAAINQARVDGRLQVKAVASAAVVTVTNLRRTGGSLSDVSINAVTTNFTGGLASGGFFKVTAVTDDVLSVSPAPATDDNAGASSVTIKGSMLRNPTGKGNLPHQQIIAQSFTAETSYGDVNQYFTHNGLRVGSFSMDISTGAIVTGTYSFEGKETKRLPIGTTLLGAAPFTPLSSTGTEVMNATTNVGSIEYNGVELASALQSISLEGDATLRQQAAVGSKFARGIGTGRFNLTGTITAYFENGVLYDAFIKHETASLAFKFTDIDGNSYKYTLPSVKFTSDAIAPGGIDQDVMEPLEFTAFRDATTGSQFQIDRWSDVKNVSV